MTEQNAKPPRTSRAAVRQTETREEPSREPVRAKVRTRKGSGTDRLAIAQDLIPPGIDLQWVPDTILGQPAVQERMAFEVNAWEPVLPHTNPDFKHFDGMFMPKGHRGEINVGGLVLMWRPMELTLEARAEDQKAARDAYRAEEAKIRGGMVDGVTLDTQHPRARANTFINKERIPSMPVPR